MTNTDGSPWRVTRNTHKVLGLRPVEPPRNLRVFRQMADINTARGRLAVYLDRGPAATIFAGV